MTFSLLAKSFRPLPFPKGAHRNSGMSLIEIIIVVALLGTLMTYLVSNLMNTSEQAKADQAKIAMGAITQSLQIYRTHTGRYPTTDQGLDSLLRNPGDSNKWRGPYIEENKLRDPWDLPFAYNSDGRDFQIISGGIDQSVGTADDVVYPEGSASGGGGGEAKEN